MKTVRALGRGVAAALAACMALCAPVAGQYGALNGEWRSYGGDVGGTKYSPLDQIDAANFSSLVPAWSWTTVDAMLSTELAGGEWTSSSARGCPSEFRASTGRQHMRMAHQG